MGKEYNNTKSMLSKIRGIQEANRKYTAKPLNEETVLKEDDNFLTRSKILMEETEKKVCLLKEEDGKNEYVIHASDPQFGNLRASQEDMIRKTIGDVELKDDALVYYPDIDDVVLNGMVKGVNIKFQFRLNDGTGDGVYVTMGETQLSDANTKTIEKIRAAFQNWKSSITEDGKLMGDLENAAKRKKENPE